MLVGRHRVVLRRGAALATALLALLAAPAAANLQVSVPDSLLQMRFLQPDQNPVNFGAWPAGSGTVGPVNVTFTNPPNSDVNVSVNSVSFVSTVAGDTPGDYSESDDCPRTVTENSLPPGGECTVSVFFSPGGKGPRNATLRVADNRQNDDIRVLGSGTVHMSHTPNSLTFGNQGVNT